VAKRSKTGEAFDVDLSPELRQSFTQFLCTEIEAAYAARVGIIGSQGEIDYYHFCYEQGRSASSTLRWDGAADLASYIITEKVDAMRARMTKTIMGPEPVWTVEGWGPDAQKAPFAEEFHQWKLEDERLQTYLTKALHNALIEGNGILEVIDRADRRLVKRTQHLACKMAEDGSPLLGEDNQPQLDTDEHGIPKPAVEGAPSVQAEVQSYQTVRKGPGYRVVSLRDFLYLPGHAADKAELFGMMKRCYVRLSALQERALQGYYANVEDLSSGSDRHETTASLERSGQQIAEQNAKTAEKELWEGLILYDCDGDGLDEWYLVTVHVPSKSLLRLKHDDLGIPRYMDFCPFPRPDSLYGYSYAGHKLLTLNEEHTAIRNMIADRSTLATTPPLMRMQGALWNPEEQPFGTGAVLDVRNPNEITPMVIPDVPASAINREQAVLSAAERVSGQNDIATGATSGEQRTLGERTMQAESSFVRVEEPVKHCQETMEDLFLVRNEIWIRTLNGQDGGIQAPDRVVRNITNRGLELEDGKFTASMLRGNLRGKPKGSVETADKGRMRNDWNQSLSAMAGMAKMNQLFGMILQHPTVAKSLLEQWARLYNVSDRHAFMEAAKEVVQKLQAEAQMQAQMPGALPPGGDVVSALPPQLQALLTQGGAPEGM
jgi:hypothetical protein